MTRSDGFDVMDVSTSIVNDPKFRRLHRDHPDHVAVGFMVYMAVVGESWKAGGRVTAADAWPVYTRFDPATIEAMQAADLLDSKGMIPARTWRGWFTVAYKRREATRERWRRANANRAAEATQSDDDEARLSHESDAVKRAVRRERQRLYRARKRTASTNDSASTPEEPRGTRADTGAIPSVRPSVPPVPSEPSDSKASPTSKRGRTNGHEKPDQKLARLEVTAADLTKSVGVRQAARDEIARLRHAP